MRDNFDAIAINKAGLAKKQHHMRRILERNLKVTGDPAIASALNKKQKMIEQQENVERYARKPRQKCTKNAPPKRKDFKSPEGFNQCGAVLGRSYASRAGERMEKKQEGFPDVMRHPTTIHNMILPLTGDFKASLDACRPRMRSAFGNLSDGAQISGRFQIAMKTAEYMATIFPLSELPTCLDPIDRPDEVFALLHWHGIIADPYLTKQEVRRVVKKAFPGPHRVCVARVQPERINKHGEITHGAQGYLEYACLDKTEVKFNKYQQKIEAIHGFAQLSSQVHKRNLSFTMGKSLAVSGVTIDPSRVLQLELNERLDDIKKNWKTLSYAEQFIHLWMSGVISIIRKPQSWLKLSTSVSDCFLSFLSLVKNWCDDPSAIDTCFYDYAGIALE
jgi:hypothetical protein